MNTDALIRALASEAAPVKPLPHPMKRYVYWLAGALCFLAAGVAAIGFRADLPGAISEPGFLLQAASLLLLALTATASAFYLGVPGKVTAPIRWLPGIALAGCLLVFLVPVLLDAHGHAGSGLRCLRNILLLSLAPVLTLYLMLWRAFPLAGNAAGLLAALGTFALGCFGTRFICPQEGALHFLVWHCVPVVALAAVGALVGKRLFRTP